MENKSSSYRPHDPGHDYYAPGIYLITLVVRDRNVQYAIFGELNEDLKNPAMKYSDVGKAVMACWDAIPAYQAKHGRKVKVHRAICMPDHFHGVLEVMERMDVSVGEVICGFKAGCTQRWRHLLQPCTAEDKEAAKEKLNGEPEKQSGEQEMLSGRPEKQSGEPEMQNGRQIQKPYLASEALSAKPDLHRMSRKQRAEYYAQHPEVQQPLWDDNYDDTICLSDPFTGEYSARHFTAMLKYVDDNVRRAIVRRLRPQFMQRCLHVEMRVVTKEGLDVVRNYAAFGNLFLLRWAKKVQVFCHRRAADGHTPYETTAEYQRDREQWEMQIMAGGTVIVTPGISRGECLMKELCMEKGYPLIHLQKEPIGWYWKPEARRFDACSQGRLLILAPWKAEELGDVNDVPSGTNYSMFHNLNTLAEEICRFEGDAIVKGGMP